MAVVEGAAGPAPPELRPRAGTASPHASIVVPVNAQGDPENVLTLLDDVGRYGGPYELEILLWRYLRYRLRYNLRVLPVRPGVAARMGREREPVPVHRANRPVR